MLKVDIKSVKMNQTEWKDPPCRRCLSAVLCPAPFVRHVLSRPSAVSTPHVHFPLRPHVVGGCVEDDCVIRGVVLPDANDGVWLSHSHWRYSDDSHSQRIARPSLHHKGSTLPSRLCRNTPTLLPPDIGRQYRSFTRRGSHALVEHTVAACMEVLRYVLGYL